MNLDSLIFDLEMANRRLPSEPTDGSYNGDSMDSNERDEWKSIRARLPEMIQLARELRDRERS